MSKSDLLLSIGNCGENARFVANVIQTHHRNPARKLKGLLELLTNGHSVRTGQFEIDALIIDGKRYGWEVLESPAIVEKWARFADAR